MKALVFAAGIGSRLRPYTDKHTKALVDVGGKPMLRNVIDRLTAAGVDDITVNVHHFAGQIKDYLSSVKSEIPAEIHISDESECLLDTGGGILRARKYLDSIKTDEPFIVHNADILSTVDLQEMITHHTDTGADATLLVCDRDTSRKLAFDHSGRMHGWMNLGTGEIKAGPSVENPGDITKMHMLALGGIHILTPKVFPLLEKFAHTAGDKFSIIPFYINCTDLLDIRAYCPARDSYSWYDIGKPETLEKARQWLAARNIHFL